MLLWLLGYSVLFCEENQLSQWQHATNSNVTLQVLSQQHCTSDNVRRIRITMCTSYVCGSQSDSGRLPFDPHVNAGSASMCAAATDGVAAGVSPPKSYTHQQPDGQDLTTESDRLKTFSARHWPRWAALQPHQLAPEGFYYSGVRDEVRCFNCNVLLRLWKAEDNVRERHRRASPSCSFLIMKDNESGRQQHQMSVNGTSHGMEEESKRLATFSCKWPSYCPVEPSGLAKSGFFYTGQEDSVQCFSCRITLKGWEHGDTAEGEHRRHSPFCPFLNGNDRQNVPWNTSRQQLLPKQELRPIANLQFEHVRIQTFTNWPHNPSVSPDDLAEAGFYYTGNRDAVQCFQCSVVVDQWVPGDVPVEEHLKHSPDCSFAKAVAQRKMQWESLPTRCAESTAESMNTYERRLASFKEWPQDTPVSAQDLAMAGFYSTGLGDRVRCFSCGGALKGWQREDTAWGEHSKYFPSCQHVQQHAPMAVIPSQDEPWSQPPQSLTKQQLHDNYIQLAVDMGFSKELASRVKARHQTTVTSFENFLELLIDQAKTTAEASGGCQSAASIPQPTVVPTSPPQPPQSLTKQKLHDNYIQLAVEMGFSKELASQVKTRHQATVSSFENFLELLIDQAKTTAETSGGCQSAASIRQPTLVPTAPPRSLNLHDELEQTKQSRLCKICMEKEAIILFLPCAHILCCQVCADSVRECPVCRSAIQSRIRSFFA